LLPCGGRCCSGARTGAALWVCKRVLLTSPLQRLAPPRLSTSLLRPRPLLHLPLPRVHLPRVHLPLLHLPLLHLPLLHLPIQRLPYPQGSKTPSPRGHVPFVTWGDTPARPCSPGVPIPPAQPPALAWARQPPGPSPGEAPAAGTSPGWTPMAGLSPVYPWAAGAWPLSVGNPPGVVAARQAGCQAGRQVDRQAGVACPGPAPEC